MLDTSLVKTPSVGWLATPGRSCRQVGRDCSALAIAEKEARDEEWLERARARGDDVDDVAARRDPSRECRGEICRGAEVHVRQLLIGGEVLHDVDVHVEAGNAVDQAQIGYRMSAAGVFQPGHPPWPG